MSAPEKSSGSNASSDSYPLYIEPEFCEGPKMKTKFATVCCKIACKCALNML
jgi:hypothetical protein